MPLTRNRKSRIKKESSPEWARMERNIEKIITETIHREMMSIRAELLPYISDEEQKDVETLYRRPRPIS